MFRLLPIIPAALLPCMALADLTTARKMARSGDFQAEDTVQCAQEVGEALGPCTAEVAWSEDASVVSVTFPNGFARFLMFENGDFLRGNATMSGVGTDTEWHRSNGVYHIRVDDQRFEIPQALILGK